MKTNLKDIAEKTGLDISTVSRALRNDVRVKEGTKLRVKELAKRLKYVPDYSAHVLAGGKSGIIGIILPEIKHTFYAEIFERISEICLEKEFLPELFLTEFNPLRIENISNRLVSQKVEGIILAYHNIDFPFPVGKKGIPVVSIDMVDNGFNEVDRVIIDNFSGAKEAVKYLISLGHHRIGFISDRVTTSRRLDGYKSALKEENLEVDNENMILIRSGRNEEVGYQTGLKFLVRKDRPSAVFCVNDLIAVGLLRAAFEIGVKIPEELSIIGFDDLPLSSYLPIPLTTVRQPIKEIVRESLYLLLERMGDVDKKPYQTKTLPTELVIRKTTKNGKF